MMILIPLSGKRGEGLAAIVDDDLASTLSEGAPWHLASTGYVVRGARTDDHPNRKESMHRVVKHVDHRNLNKLDNRRSNLRSGTQAQNNQNVRGIARTSKYRGVWWDARTERWAAAAVIDRKSHWAGRFVDEIEAARAAQALRMKLLPFTTEEMI